VTRYALFQDKLKLPVSRQKVNEDVIPKELRFPRQTQLVHDLVAENVEQLFGFSVKHIQRQTASKTSASQAKTTTAAASDYILLAAEPPVFPFPPSEADKQGPKADEYKKRKEDFDRADKEFRRKRLAIGWENESPNISLVCIILALIEIEGVAIDESTMPSETSCGMTVLR